MFLEFLKGYRLKGSKNKSPPCKVILMCKFCLRELSIAETILRPTSKNIISSNTTRVSTPNESSRIKALLKMRNEIPSCIFL